MSFNPRTRDGCESKSVAPALVAAGVSIHAPVMGANNISLLLSSLYSFNPRTRDGCENAYATI